MTVIVRCEVCGRAPVRGYMVLTTVVVARDNVTEGRAAVVVCGSTCLRKAKVVNDLAAEQAAGWGTRDLTTARAAAGWVA